MICGVLNFNQPRFPQSCYCPSPANILDYRSPHSWTGGFLCFMQIHLFLLEMSKYKAIEIVCIFCINYQMTFCTKYTGDLKNAPLIHIEPGSLVRAL